jgi:hypothetical protein
MIALIAVEGPAVADESINVAIARLSQLSEATDITDTINHGYLVSLLCVFEQAGGRIIIEGELLETVLTWMPFKWEPELNNTVFAWLVWRYEGLRGMQTLRLLCFAFASEWKALPITFAVRQRIWQILVENGDAVQQHHAELFGSEQEEQRFALQMEQMRAVLAERQIRAMRGE